MAAAGLVIAVPWSPRAGRGGAGWLVWILVLPAPRRQRPNGRDAQGPRGADLRAARAPRVRVRTSAQPRPGPVTPDPVESPRPRSSAAPRTWWAHDHALH